MDIYLYIALTCYALLMLCIGCWQYKSASSNVKGFILGGRDVSPKVTALSAGASDMSGWMLMGLPGAMFLLGMETIWIAKGLLIGALLNYLLIAPKLRIYTQIAGDALTIPQFIANRFGEKKGVLRLTTASVSILFFTLYTAAGLVAGGKLFETVFHLSYQLGVLFTMSLVLAYTLLGGFKAVSTADFVQGSIMVCALVAVPWVAASHFDSFGELHQIGMTFMHEHSSQIRDASSLALLSSLAWGLGYFGQPHILVRFMAIKTVVDIGLSARIGIIWMFICLGGAIATGFVGIAYIQKFALSLDDPETIFVVFSQVLFHPFVAGILLSAILAAVMSTISSQLLVSSSSLTEDIYKVFFNSDVSESKGVLLSRIAVLGVAFAATLLALGVNNSVLTLVGHAWAGFGAAFGPIIVLSLYWPSITRAGAIAGILSGAITVILWITLPQHWIGIDLSATLYEIIPGFIVATFTTVLVSLFTHLPDCKVISDFHMTTALLEADSK